MIKAIETQYKGYRFRSRLEARWAVFFDTLGIEWIYEPEGFDLGEAGWYLPDFWIDYGGDNQYWIEVKAHKNLSDREYAVALSLSKHAPGFIMLGQPEAPTYKGGWMDAKGAAYSGSWAISFGKYSDTQGVSDADFLSFELSMQERLFCWHERSAEAGGGFLLWPVPARELLNLDIDAQIRFVKEGWATVEDWTRINPILAGTKFFRSANLISAYTTARSSRFEHGEKG